MAVPNKLNISRFLMILGVVFVYSSCETTVDIDIPFEKPQVTVNSSLANNTFPKVRVTYSKHILDNNWEFEPIRDAEVKLIHQGETYPLSFDEATGEYISLDHMISEGNEYKIEVLVAGYEPVTATEIIPTIVPIKNLVYQGQVQVDSWSSRDDIQLIFDDPAGENYYEISAHYYRTYTYTDQEGNLVYYEENYPLYLEPKNPSYEKDFNTDGELLIDDKLFDGAEAKIDLFINGSYFTEEMDGEVSFTLKAVTRNYYLFHSTYGLQWWNDGDPFAQPVQVYSNISNGIGIVMGESISVKRMEE
ncbi:DUF4249 domain-containing protein [Cyclobacterium plantarum]|uniref:DUF4249 domain-containing protein n=1 Tax=Cyclobacterium plantarum TaxID=2716263 RepID=A0ABX0H8B5_9BACT|nr:DUF4249 domain-containing protein [Cyclobacterium plantarum]NHE56628.1 DUF4249 domain-containing protein [Cyclobacterium plantarum]